MNRIGNHSDDKTFDQSHRTTTSFNQDRNNLVKEIGRLRLQLHQAKLMDNSQQRAEFLREEISTLKSQINRLGV